MADIKKSLKRCAESLEAWIKEDIESIREEFAGVNILIAILYFGSFVGLILSVCLMGVNGDLFWGFFALLFAVAVLIVGYSTGAF